MKDREIKLGGNWHSCPLCWQNFIISFDFHDDEYDIQRLRKIQKELLKFNAEGIVDLRSEDCSTILFKTPVDKTWFIMRWS